MSEDATSQPLDSTDSTSATEDEHAQQLLVDAMGQTPDADPADDDDSGSEKPQPGPDRRAAEDKLGDSGKRALTSERRARRDAEKQLNELRTRLAEYEDRDKSELQKAQEAAQRYEQELLSTRVANARLMAAAVHNLPPDLIDLLGSGSEEEIDARAKLLAEKLAAAQPVPAAPEAEPPRPAQRRPVESLTPGARPAGEAPADPNEAFRGFLNNARR